MAARRVGSRVEGAGCSREQGFWGEGYNSGGFAGGTLLWASSPPHVPQFLTDSTCTTVCHCVCMFLLLFLLLQPLCSGPSAVLLPSLLSQLLPPWRLCPCLQWSAQCLRRLSTALQLASCSNVHAVNGMGHSCGCGVLGWLAAVVPVCSGALNAQGAFLRLCCSLHAVNGGGAGLLFVSC
jgi:hypothetical protein